MLKYNLIDNNKKDYIVLLHAYAGNSRCFKKQLITLNSMFNVLLVDMHGHGESSSIHLDPQNEQAMFEKVVSDIDAILNKLNINKAHFMGLSLGTIIANLYAYYHPNKVLSILNAGAVIKFKPFIQKSLDFLYRIRNSLPKKSFYSLAGYVIMPRRSHKTSRKLFVREAQKMNNSDFFAWGRLLIDFQDIYSKEIMNPDINSLFISGDEDYFFLDEVKNHCDNNKHNLYIIKNAGHICNIDNSEEFNKAIEEFYLEMEKK